MCTCVYADASSLPGRLDSALLRQGQNRDGGAAPAARRRVRGHAVGLAVIAAQHIRNTLATREPGGDP